MSNVGELASHIVAYRYWGMGRRRDTYFGGSTVHIPGRDSRSSRDGPPKALAHAQEQFNGKQSGELLAALTTEVFEGWRQLEERGDRTGASLARFQGLDWQARLTEIIELARRENNYDRATDAKKMMWRMTKAQADLKRLSEHPESALYGDSLYWFMAWKA